MNILGEVLRGPQAARLGWTLLHLVWQGALVWAAAAAVLALLRKRGPAGRYLVATAGLLILAAAPVVTFLAVGATSPVDPPAPAPAEPMAWAPDIETMAEPAPALAPAVPPLSPAPVEVIAAPEPPPVSLRQRIEAALRPWLPHIVGGWLVGVLLLTAWRAGGWVQVRRLKRRCTSDVPAGLRATLSALAARLRVSRPVRLVQSGIATVPTVIGWLRPVILLPTAALTGLTPEQLEAVLAHELAHIRRHDGLVNVLQAVIEMLLFYHPAVWWLSRRMRIEREQCCDDVAVAACGGGVLYGRALAAMEALRAAPSPGLSARGGDLLARVRRILGKPDARERASSSRWLAGILTVAVLLAIAAVPLVSGGTAPAEGGAVAEEGIAAAGGTEEEVLPHFTATLPNGVTVELIGVSYHPSAGKPWWRPDGSPLPVAGYDGLPSGVDTRGMWREFVVRLSGAPTDDIWLNWAIDGARAHAGGGNVEVDGKLRSDVRGLAASIMDGEEACTVTLGVASGTWHTIGTSGPGGVPALDRSHVSFTNACLDGKDVRITASDEAGYCDRRVVGIDSSGRVRLPTAASTEVSDAGGPWETTARFRAVDAAQVKEFRLEVRPRDRVEFRNVSLQPGQKTDVNVVMAPQAEQAPAAQVSPDEAAAEAVREATRGPAATALAQPAAQGPIVLVEMALSQFTTEGQKTLSRPAAVVRDREMARIELSTEQMYVFGDGTPDAAEPSVGTWTEGLKFEVTPRIQTAAPGKIALHLKAELRDKEGVVRGGGLDLMDVPMVRTREWQFELLLDQGVAKTVQIAAADDKALLFQVTVQARVMSPRDIKGTRYESWDVH